MDPTKAVSCAADRTIKVWDLTKGYCIRTMMCHSTCNTVCLVADGNMICSGHFDGTVRFWDVQKGELERELPGVHAQQVTSLSLAPNGCEMLTNSRDNSLKILDTRSFEISKLLKAPTYHAGTNWSQACFSPDGQQVAAGGADGSLHFWDLHASNLNIAKAVLPGHAGAIARCSWSSTGTFVASVDIKNGECILWH
mmetsp:Transcript_23823/g.52035  ORF Transcript_23823/g.52035 Transcript_23823/m.52035 type:complete len:196 (-) Transcript_23823:188-775(-)